MSEGNVKFICTIIAVEDIPRSRKLYETILGQKVIADFGIYNVAFEGGLALYHHGLYQSLIGDKSIQRQTNNFELYFEEDDLSAVEAEIERNGFEFLHKTREEPWKQQVFRFYDYDGNIVVIAESMQQVSYRLFNENKTVEEIAQMTGEPVEQVVGEIKDYQKRLLAED
jgi:catechol 2,3-dioxygenase-like lactoylglutathione lyase family enzyme